MDTRGAKSDMLVFFRGLQKKLLGLEAVYMLRLLCAQVDQM